MSTGDTSWMSNHGYITSCLGPVVDVQVASNLLEVNKEI